MTDTPRTRIRTAAQRAYWDALAPEYARITRIRADDFHWGPHHFPCFNVADSFITVAAGLLIVMGIVESWKEQRLKNRKGDARHGQA